MLSYVYRSIIFFTVSVFSFSAYTQAYWTRTYGGGDEEAGMSLVETPDSGYLVVGITGSYGNGASDAYILKTDSVGQFVWHKTYGGANVDVAQKVLKVSGGGYFVAGYSNSYTLDYDFWIIRLDENGDSLWTKKIGGDDWDRAYSAVSDDNGSYFVVGETYSGNNLFSDGLIVKIDDFGDTLWTRTFRLPGNESFRDVVKISDTRYAAVGTTEQGVTKDGFLLFFDSAGTFLDTVYYDYGKDEFLTSMAIAPNGEMMLGGYYHYDERAFPRSLQIKVDTLGAVFFYLMPDTMDEFGMQILSYGHYAGSTFFFCGHSFYKSTSDHQAVVLKSWPDGYPEWLRSYGLFPQDESANAVIKTYDNGFLAVGYTKSYGPGTQALLMYKIAADGFAVNSTVVDIEEIAISHDGISVYPNPASDQVTFSATNDFSLRLLSSDGKEVSIGSHTKGNLYTISTSRFTSGYYYGEMRFTDGSVHYEKIYILSK